jgi:hypothetical protein
MSLQFVDQLLHEGAAFLADEEGLALGAEEGVLHELAGSDEEGLQHPAGVEEFEGLFGGHENHNYKEEGHFK